MNTLRVWPAPAATGGSQLSAPIPTAYCCGNMAAGSNANEGANRNMDTVANANVDEIATFVEEVQHLEELDEAIVRIESEIGNSRNPEFEAYRLARAQNPTYVSSRDFTIGFLRAEFYDAEKAAARMFDYLKMKLEIFGEEKLTRDIVLDDLDEHGREILERGGLQVLPRPDAAGRPVVFGHAVLNVNAERRDIEIESAKKAYFYFWTSLSEDVNTRQGVVGIIWRVHNPPLPDKNLAIYLSRIWRCAPIKLTDYYLCYGGSKTLDKFLWSMLVSWFAEKSVRPRLYFGETVEVMYKLKTTHGIQALPIHLGLQPRIHNTDHLNGWMARRRSIDQNRNTGKMAKRFVLLGRFQLFAMAATFWVVNIVAFQPPALLNRIGTSPSTGMKHLPSLNACGIAKASVVSLNSADKDDPPDIVVVKNVQEDSGEEESTDDKVDELLALLDSVPSNLPTSRSMTDRILNAVQNLEAVCPTPEDKVLSELSGNWELLWTAQDKTSEQYLKGGLANVIINPLENQSYANNPFLGGNTFLFGEEEQDGGRANPVLPREIQDVLERTGILEASGGTKLAPIRSSQGIDIKRKRVRNVVNVQFKKPFAIKGSLIVDVDFTPNQNDARRIDVKFDSCRLIFQNNIDRRFPLGIFGPRGWLRTGYVDDRIRITRGHKGSVFILSRTAKRRSV